MAGDAMRNTSNFYHGKRDMMREISIGEVRKFAEIASRKLWQEAKVWARDPKIYLHWTAGRYGQLFDAYHINIDADGALYVVTENFAEILAHTWLRNSGAIGITLACALDATSRSLGDFPPTQMQIEVMAATIAEMAEGICIPIDRYHVLTHGEAADNEDGICPHAPYGPKSGCERWDLEYLGTEESPVFAPYATGQRGGDILRGKAIWYQQN